MNTAYITLIPKPNKDHTSCSNYRPVSLINTDIKIISKALLVRLESGISSSIHIDQTGFIKGRHFSENTQRLFNVINFYKNNTSPNKTPFIIATLDAEKAFDWVDRSFLFTSLNHFGFQSYFTNWIKTLYNSPTASVITNGIISKPFQLLRGTRQGCPLSPLLFALFIEPMAASIRQSNHITGIQSKSHHHKISLYADDILLYITNPSSSLPSVHNLISSYSQVSGYFINWTKSEILPMDRWDAEARDPFLSHTDKAIKYLGIHIFPNLNELFKLNHTPLLQEIKDNLERWNKLPLSLIGRISTVKLNILPKINYLFSMITVTPPSDWFSSLNSTVTKFYWKNKKTRIKLSTLQNHKQHGGLGAPNFYFYFLSQQLLYIRHWTNNINPPWLEIESNLTQELQIQNLTFIDKSIKTHPSYKNNNTINITLSVWWKSNEVLHSSFSPSVLTPIWNNPMFLINNRTFAFSSWIERGVTSLGQLFNDGLFVTFDHIKKEYNIPDHCYFQFIQ